MSLKNTFAESGLKEGGEDWVTNEGTDLGSTERIITPVGPGI